MPKGDDGVIERLNASTALVVRGKRGSREQRMADDRGAHDICRSARRHRYMQT